MSERVLVGYATKAGSTKGVAERIAEVLGERGFGVDLKPMTEVASLDVYDKVVLGSAVNGGAWLPEAVAFVESHVDALSQVPLAVFSVHAMNAGSDPKQTTRRLAYLNKVRAVVQPEHEGYFLGKGPDGTSSGVGKWFFKAFGGAGEGDMRDWDAIAKWARELCAE